MQPGPPPEQRSNTPDADWLATAQANIARAEYHVSRSDSDGGLTAPNRAQDLRARWQDGSLTITPRTDGGAWSFRYELAAVGRVGAAQRDADLRIVGEDVRDGRVEWRRGASLSEWYMNDERGIEQGFVLDSPPPGDRDQPVAIDGRIDGLLALPAEDGQSVLLRTASGADAMRIHGLVVRDATGVELPACLEVTTGTLSILVRDERATYPLVIDPLMSNPTWTAESDQAFAYFGWSVATAGDVNGDQFSDAIVGAYYYDNGMTNEGRAYVYLGSPAGLPATPAWTASGGQEGAEFGVSVATAGDVNGDGFSDVIVGADMYSNGELGEGRAYVFHGSASGLAPTPSWTMESNKEHAEFGAAVATAGDVNGDGFSDVIIGAPGYHVEHEQEGRAAVYHGTASGLEVTLAWVGRGGWAGARYGERVATAGDVNGDGFGDVIVGAPSHTNDQVEEGRAYVYHGSATGLATPDAWRTEGDQTQARLGTVGTAGDVNGDGYSDVIVGAYLRDNGETDEGMSYVFHGSASGVLPTAAWTAEGNLTDAGFGVAVGTAGDVNGDGYADVVVGAWSYNYGVPGQGRAFVHHGSASGLSASWSWAAAGAPGQQSFFGYSVGLAGDVNADGYSDVIVGAIYHSNGQTNEGRALVYHGSPMGLGYSPAWIAEGNAAEACMGYHVATAGDVNGDGYSDVIVSVDCLDSPEINEGGAFVFHGSATGLATTPDWTAESNQVGAGFSSGGVATAGDVNGDGYSDVIVGARDYDNPEIDEGRVFVYHGSPSGLSATAAWTAESNQAGALFGASVGTAGDVNGDGFSDVIVGAPLFDNGQADEGRAFVYLGSPAGLPGAAAWTAEGNLVSAFFGNSVGTAGDVNADGFSDVIIGAPGAGFPGFPQIGQAFAYSGSALGLSGGYSWYVYGTHAYESLGTSVATAGDVNGDGFADVLVGSPGWINGQDVEGRADVHHGSASGLFLLPAWSVEGNQALGQLGTDVASAGDVNGDGFSDIVVSAPSYDSPETDGGMALVWHGSASGIVGSLATAWVWTSGQANAYLHGIGSAGDVNGDGYSDIVLGSSLYTNDLPHEGRVWMFYGNDGDGLDRLPRQRRADDSAPIDVLGLGDSFFGSLVRTNGRAPFGRGSVRMELQFARRGQPFSGPPFLTAWTNTGAPGPNGSVWPLSLPVGAASPADHYRWRVRLRTRFPFPWQSHWMSMPYNGQSEADFRIP